MKLWLISQEKNCDWDTYDSAVVVADNADDAKRIHPNGDVNEPPGPAYSSWALPEFVTATYIGETEREAGEVICASFNAG